MNSVNIAITFPFLVNVMNKSFKKEKSRLKKGLTERLLPIYFAYNRKACKITIYMGDNSRLCIGLYRSSICIY